ncbi:MAG TPA: nitrile hydratase subunit beta [Stellaceae bacterium]|jgi:nitrile hydratase|nr:nitrile hydratase subunit beta [Stellaceae bacterium]
MNGVHDMGGMHGFGPVTPEKDEPVFHADWEGRVFAMQRATFFLGVWNLDMARASVEKLPPDFYLGASYYEKWEAGLESRLLSFGLVVADELASGHALHPAKAAKPKLTAAEVEKGLQRGSYSRPAQAPARFAPGAKVRTKNINPTTHTRLPRYARDRVGVIEAIRGCHVFPDSVVLGKGEDPQWLYTVVFDGKELWGEQAAPGLKVSIEAWEPYLEPA